MMVTNLNFWLVTQVLTSLNFMLSHGDIAFNSISTTFKEMYI